MEQDIKILVIMARELADKPVPMVVDHVKNMSVIGNSLAGKVFVDVITGASPSEPEKPDYSPSRVRGFPTRGDEVREMGKQSVSFLTAGERSREIARKTSATLLMKMISRYRRESKIEWDQIYANAEIIKNLFDDTLKEAGISADIYSREEILQLIKENEWFWTTFAADFKVSNDIGGTPILVPLGAKILMPNDKFQARTRVVLAMLEIAGASISLEVYAGYLIEDWALPGKAYQITTASDKIFEIMKEGQRQELQEAAKRMGLPPGIVR